jgi:excisionase family DNA binding protein
MAAEPLQFPKRLLSKKEFCTLYGVSFTTFYELLKGGQLKALKCGAKTLIDEAEAERWKASLPSYQSAHGAAHPHANSLGWRDPHSGERHAGGGADTTPRLSKTTSGNTS